MEPSFLPKQEETVIDALAKLSNPPQGKAVGHIIISGSDKEKTFTVSYEPPTRGAHIASAREVVDETNKVWDLFIQNIQGPSSDRKEQAENEFLGKAMDVCSGLNLLSNQFHLPGWRSRENFLRLPELWERIVNGFNGQGFSSNEELIRQTSKKIRSEYLYRLGIQYDQQADDLEVSEDSEEANTSETSTQNRGSAFAAYRQAAEMGHVEAMRQVCIAYINGHGVESDLNQAEAWLSKLENTGYFRPKDRALYKKRQQEYREFVSCVDSSNRDGLERAKTHFGGGAE